MLALFSENEKKEKNYMNGHKRVLKSYWYRIPA